MRSLPRKVSFHAPDACGSLLAWGEGALGHMIGYGVRPSCSAGDRDEVAYRGSGPIPLPSPTRPDALPPRYRETAQAARIAILRQGLAKLERSHGAPAAHLSLGVGEMH